MGLLDVFNDPNAQMGLGLLAAAGPSATPMSFGQRLQGVMQQMQAQKIAEEERKQKAAMQSLQARLIESQIGETQAQAQQRQAQAQEMQRKLQEQQRIQDVIRGAVSPTRAVDANAASGITGPRPEALAAVNQPRQIDAQALIAQGVPAELAKNLLEARNWGRDEVSRTIETTDANGMPVTRQYGKYGNEIGGALPKPVEMKLEDLGGSKQAYNPFALQAGQQFKKTNTPDALLGANVTMRGQNMTDARARDANNIASAGNVIKAETDIRKEFADLPEVKKYKMAIPAYAAIKDAASRDTAQSDINLIYGLAKVYDPDSVVREGEFSTIAKSQSIPDWLKGQAQYIAGGGRLTARTKSQILTEASGRIAALEKEYSAAKGVYEGVTKRRGGDVENVFTPVGASLGLKVVRSGKDASGRRVNQMSDGSIVYAD